jgi:hypothetical protein
MFSKLLKNLFNFIVYINWYIRSNNKEKNYGQLVFKQVLFSFGHQRHRWALSPISVISDIRLSLISEHPISY